MTIDKPEIDLKPYHPFKGPLTLLKFMAVIAGLTFSLIAIYELFLR